MAYQTVSVTSIIWLLLMAGSVICRNIIQADEYESKEKLNEDAQKDMFQLFMTDKDEIASEQADALSSLIQYAGMGYNILEANPEGDFYRGGVDPGIKKTRFIFKHTYDQGKKAYYQGKETSLPDEVEFHSTHSCTMTETTDAYTGQKSYKNELSLNVETSASIGLPLLSVSFSLSSGMKEVRERTEQSSSVVVQKTKICNYGQVRYKFSNTLNGGYSLSDDFKNSVKLLPSSYSTSAYVKFLDDWGTHFLESVELGTREITRTQASYSKVYDLWSKENTAGVTLGGSYDVVSGSVSVDTRKLVETVKQNEKIRSSLTSYTIGTREIPSPIHTKVTLMTSAFQVQFYDPAERVSVNQKRINLERAIREYPANKRASISNDPIIRVPVQWPADTFSLVQSSSGCPQGFSSGWRLQDNEDKNNANSWTPSNIKSYLRIGTGRNYKFYYCTKTVRGTSLFAWPRGRYCIASYGNYCPSGFSRGSRFWDDEDRNNINNSQGLVPDGENGRSRNTRVFFCCRSDGSANTAIMLPPQTPFVLYRYDGVCQRVRGAKVTKTIFVHFDDEDSGNANKCTGSFPDGSCGGNHDINMCYYSF